MSLVTPHAVPAASTFGPGVHRGTNEAIREAEISVRSRCVVGVRSVCGPCAVGVRSVCGPCAVGVRSVCGPCAVRVRSVCGRCASDAGRALAGGPGADVGGGI